MDKKNILVCVAGSAGKRKINNLMSIKNVGRTH